MQKKTQITWVNEVKGIAMIAIVLLHSDYAFHDSVALPLWALLGNAWHVGVLFVISGFFIREEQLSSPATFLKKKFLSLYLKMLIFYWIAILLHNTFISIGIYDTSFDYHSRPLTVYSIADTVKELILATLGAGREPVIAPLWFVYCLFAAYVFLSCSRFVFLKIVGNMARKEWYYGAMLLTCCTLGHIVTNVMQWNIPRYGNIFSVAWLVYLGFIIKQKVRIDFDSWKMFALSLTGFYLCVVVFGANSLINNNFHNVISMTLCIVCALYCLCYFCKRHETALGFLEIVGKESYYIMAGHIMCFKLCTVMLRQFGYDFPLYVLNSPDTNSVWLLLLYTAFGVCMPIITARIIRYGYRRIVRQDENITHN